MLAPVLLINGIFAVAAVIYGLFSRTLATAAVAGFWVGLVHAALLGLVAAQTGSMAELPYLKDGVDLIMNTGHLTFPHARMTVYLVAAGLALMLGMIALRLIVWVPATLIGLARPRKPVEL